MKNLLTYSLSCISLLASSALSAQTTNSLFRHLPPNAEKVYHINLPVIGPKADWAAIVNKFSAGKEGKNQKIASLLKDPAASGLDLKQDIIIADGPIDPADSSHWITAIMHLTDSSKFAAAVHQLAPDIKYFTFPGKGRAASAKKQGVAYDDKFAVFTSFERPAHKDSDAKTKTGASQQPVNIARQAAQKSLAALNGFDNSFFVTDEKFKTAFSDDADLHIMTPQSSMRDAMLSIAKNAKLGDGTKTLSGVMSTKTSHSYAAIRFDIGKITVRATSPLDPNTLSDAKAVLNTPLNTDLVARIPGTTLLGIADFHFSPAGLLQILAKNNIQGKIDSGLSKLGLSTSDIMQAFKGDFVFGATQGVGDKPVTFYLTATINDAVSFQKLTRHFGFKSDADDPSQGSVQAGKFNASYKIKDNIFAISLSKEAVDAYFTNTAKRSTDFITDRTLNGAVSLYVDLASVGAYLANAKDGAAQKAQQAAFFLQMLQSLTLNIANISGTDNETFIELKLADQQQNSLTFLSRLVTQ